MHLCVCVCVHVKTSASPLLYSPVIDSVLLTQSTPA